MNDSRPQKPPEEDEGDPSGSGSGVCTLGTEESEMAVREEDVGKGLGERVLKWAAEAEGGMLGAVLVSILGRFERGNGADEGVGCWKCGSLCYCRTAGDIDHWSCGRNAVGKELGGREWEGEAPGVGRPHETSPG